MFRHERIIPKTPRQNRIGLLSRLDVCFPRKKIKHTLFGEAVKIMMDLIKLSIVAFSDEIIRRECREERIFQTNYESVYRVFVYIPRDERSKIDRKTKQSIFLRHSVTSLDIDHAIWKIRRWLGVKRLSFLKNKYMMISWIIMIVNLLRWFDWRWFF